MEQTALMPEVQSAAPAPAPIGGTGAEFTVNTRDLLKELSNLQRIVPRKTTVPILVNIHFQAWGNTLLLSASDVDLILRTACPARNKREGRFTLPAHKLHDYVRLLDDGDVTMRLQGNHWVQIKSGRSHTRMVGMDAEKFPNLPLFPAPSAIKLDAQPLRTLIERTLFAVCSEESRYIFNGALLLLRPEGTTMVATDGHRMAYAEYAKPQEIEETRVLVPKKALAEISSLLNLSAAEQIQFAQDDKNLYFAIGSRLLTSRQTADKFPNYEAVLPQGLPYKAVLSRQELLLALQRVAQFSDLKSNCVRVSLEKNEFRLASSSAEIGEAEDVLPATYTGEHKSIAFNSQYLLDFLKAIDCDNVRLEFKDGESATEFRPEETAAQNSSYRCIVMPLRA
jgi:DNA polymerase III subunit beta